MSHPTPLLAQDQPAPSAPQMLPGAVPATVPNAPPTDLPLAPAHDLSPLGMYNQAHWVVKAVMLSLLAACFATWTIWLFKTVELLVARRRARQSGRILARAASLDEATGRLGSRRDPATVMALAVAEEYGRSAPAIAPAGAEGIKERAQSLVARIEGQTLARARRGTGVLATIGAIAPFVGLFGTVWGIMNSFIGIAESKTTNLAVVAPGIAEALLATAIGLVAAIPAVVIYNQFSRSLAAYRLLLGDAAAAVLRLLSRDIDFRSMKG